MNDRPSVGTKLKFKVEMTASGFSMDSDLWTVTVSRGPVSHVYAKTDCVKGLDGWFVGVDTTEFGAGTYYATLTGYVPDTDFQGGVRPEVRRFYLIDVDP